jgi:hypothetical protein
MHTNAVNATMWVRFFIDSNFDFSSISLRFHLVTKPAYDCIVTAFSKRLGGLSMNMLSETLISFRAAAALLPSTQPGECVCFTTIWRWATKGICRNGERVKLDAVRIGGRWVTSHQALERFTAALNAHVVPEEQPLPLPSVQAVREREGDLP